MIAKLPIRGQDAHGAGHFNAPRGTRLHHGIDFSCYPDTEILSLCDGVVTKIGYPYANHLGYRYVEVTHDDLRYRYFYIEPDIDLQTGDEVKAGDVLGRIQDLGLIYPDITNHLHFEIKDENNEYLDPSDFT